MASWFDSDNSSVLLPMAAALAFVASWYWRHGRRMRARAKPDVVPDAAPVDAGLAARRAADAALADLLELSREFSAALDTKIRLLNRLIKEADDRIERLEAARRAADAAAASGARPKEAAGCGIREEASGGARDGDGPSRKRRSEARAGAGADLSARAADLLRSGKRLEEIQALTGLSAIELELALAMTPEEPRRVPEKRSDQPQGQRPEA